MYQCFYKHKDTDGYIVIHVHWFYNMKMHTSLKSSWLQIRSDDGTFVCKGLIVVQRAPPQGKAIPTEDGILIWRSSKPVLNWEGGSSAREDLHWRDCQNRTSVGMERCMIWSFMCSNYVWVKGQGFVAEAHNICPCYPCCPCWIYIVIRLLNNYWVWGERQVSQLILSYSAFWTVILCGLIGAVHTAGCLDTLFRGKPSPDPA